MPLLKTDQRSDIGDAELIVRSVKSHKADRMIASAHVELEEWRFVECGNSNGLVGGELRSSAARCSWSRVIDCGRTSDYL